MGSKETCVDLIDQSRVTTNAAGKLTELVGRFRCDNLDEALTRLDSALNFSSCE